MTYEMPDEHYQRMYTLEETFWWFVGIRAISEAVLRPHLPSGKKLTILDTGCGTGANIAWLQALDCKRPVIGLDYSYYALDFCRRRHWRALCQGSVMALPFQSDRFDLVTSFDVLTHIPRGEPSARTFAEYYRVLRPGGLLLVRAPAYQWLKSKHDEALNGITRYTGRELARILLRSHFRVERVSYANTLAFPLALAARLAKKIGLGGGSDVRPLPPGLRWVEGLLRVLLQAEARYLSAKLRRLPVGLSVFVVARKSSE